VITPGRALVAQRGLTAAAVGALIPVMTDVGFEELGLVKALLKRFFSDDPWTAIDAAQLATTVGPAPAGADRVVRHRLAPDLELVAGWMDDVFFLDVEVDADRERTTPNAGTDDHGPLDLSRTFDRGVVPEPTPNPRTVRFATGHRPIAVSTSHRRGDAIVPAVAAVFAADDDVVDVLVAADFVAVSLRRPDRWPEALVPVLDAVAARFAGEQEPSADDSDRTAPEPELDVRGITSSSPATDRSDHRAGRRRERRLDRAWSDLADADPTTPEGLARLRAAAAGDDSAHRQVAAQLLDRAPLDDARPLWEQLAIDPSRTVRRAALDAIAGAEDERLRPLLERALTDADAWIRWKALHGLVVLGITPSVDQLDRLDDDPDFRVRLEAANARRSTRP
jgi:hypothetical protein